MSRELEPQYLSQPCPLAPLVFERRTDVGGGGGGGGGSGHGGGIDACLVRLRR